MTYSRSLFRAAMLAAPLGLATMQAQAADIDGTIQESSQFSTLAKAVEAAGMAQDLKGSGPYTVFAPTNEAFEQLPQGALDELMKEENQSQLKAVLQYHLVEGKELAAKDAIGKQTKLDTVEGGSLSVDGTGKEVLLVPTGLIVTRMGDQVIVEREVTAVATPQVEVAPAGQQQSQQGQNQQAGSSDQSGSSQSKQQTASDQSGSAQGSASQNQQQQTASGQSQGSEGASPQQAAAGSSSSQQQDKGVLREARVVEPDIRADNGVIHAIDAVLVPQSVLSKLESMPAKQQSQNQRQGDANQG